MEMKKIGRKMSIYMGLTLSLCMSFIGNMTSGHFTVPGFLISFVVSSIICLVIGFFIPIGPVSQSVSRKFGLAERSLGARAVESLVADFIFTPVMTLAMISFAYKMATSHGEKMKFLPAFLSSLGIGMLMGFMIAFVLTPVFLKLAMKGTPTDKQ